MGAPTPAQVEEAPTPAQAAAERLDDSLAKKVDDDEAETLPEPQPPKIAPAPVTPNVLRKEPANNSELAQKKALEAISHADTSDKFLVVTAKDAVKKSVEAKRARTKLSKEILDLENKIGD